MLLFHILQHLLLCGVIHLTPALGSRVRNAINSWRRIPAGFDRPVDANGKLLKDRPAKSKVPIRVHSIAELKDLFKQGYRVPDLDVRGNITHLLDDHSKVHPVVQALHLRKQQASQPGQRTDGFKIAVAIEGGGMRGCIGAGMITVRIHYALYYVIDSCAANAMIDMIHDC